MTDKKYKIDKNMRINNIDTTTTRKRVVFCTIFAAICFAIPFWTFCCELSRLPLSIGELAAFFISPIEHLVFLS